MNRKFAILILTHGRANNVYTASTLLKCGYSGEYYIVIDDEDEQENLYREKYGDRVVVFDKSEIAKVTDPGDNLEGRKAILWARNASFGVARKLGLTHFMMLDDDYTDFEYRKVIGNKLKVISGRFDIFIKMALDFLDNTNTLSIAFAQGGDWIGGCKNKNVSKIFARKCMNTFICRTDRPFQFYGRMNEDVTTYVRNGMLGKLMFTFLPYMIVQKSTQTVKGGMTEEYLKSGTYTKSFYSIMYAPSCVKINTIGLGNRRIHHSVKWKYAVAKIINEKYRKI